MERPRHLVERQITGRAFGKRGVVIIQGPGARNEWGEFVHGAPTEYEVDMVAEPPSLQESGLMARVLEEGTRLAGAMKFYLLTSLDVLPLRTGPDPTGRDRVRYEGRTYRVARVEPWDGDHLVLHCILLDQQPTVA